MFFKEILTAILMPPFTGHDEVAHFSYIRTVATEHRLPKIPDLAEWRILQEQGDSAGARATGDFFDSDLYAYADWCARLVASAAERSAIRCIY